MKKEIKLVITKTINGYSVYDEKHKMAIDFFTANDSGQKKLIQFLCDELINKKLEDQ